MLEHKHKHHERLFEKFYQSIHPSSHLNHRTELALLSILTGNLSSSSRKLLKGMERLKKRLCSPVCPFTAPLTPIPTPIICSFLMPDSCIAL